MNMKDAAGHPLLNQHLRTYIDNWRRLGLVDVSYTGSLTGPTQYDWVEERPEMIAYKQTFADDQERSVDFDKGYIHPTDFGKAFGRVVGILP